MIGNYVSYSLHKLVQASNVDNLIILSYQYIIMYSCNIVIEILILMLLHIVFVFFIVVPSVLYP